MVKTRTTQAAQSATRLSRETREVEDDLLNAAVLQIGDRLRNARRAQKKTLSEVAEKSGMSESSLSRIERGSTALSVTTLLQLCKILNVGLDDLMSDSRPAEPSRVQITRSGDQEHEFAATGYNWLLLGGKEPLNDFKVFHLIFPEDEVMRTLVSHEGQEYCYVLDGVIDFYIGQDVHRLHKGDSIMLDSSLPHRAERKGELAAHMLMVICAAGQDHEPSDWWSLPPVGQ
ncbi:XRE family transcriptional regulator [Salipiger pacificus]|nr:XRE family transcriptional regulator [Alloyangia pacifica]